MARYANARILNNSLEFYEFLRKERGDIKNIVQYETPTLRMPRLGDRIALQTSVHIWTYGDRYYKLANQYYNNRNYWWVIAWYNGLPTETDVKPGDVIHIPLDLETALRTMGGS